MPRFTENNQPKRRRVSRRPLSAFPPMFSQVLLQIAETGQPRVKSCSSPRNAAATRQDFYRFGAALREESSGVGVNKMTLLLAAIQPNVLVRLDHDKIIFELRDFADMTAAKMMLSEMQFAAPPEVPGVDRPMTPDELKEMYKHSEAKNDK